MMVRVAAVKASFYETPAAKHQRSCDRLLFDGPLDLSFLDMSVFAFNED